MSSLHKDPRGKSPYWYCAFTHADGTRSFKSTKKVNRKEAEAVCSGWQRAVDLSKDGTLTEVQARKVLSEIYERANREPIHFTSAAQFLTEWIASKKVTTAPGTSRRYGDTVASFIKHLGPKAQRNLAAVAPQDIVTFRDLQVSAGKANKTANMETKTLRIVFNMARKHGLILSNPAEAVDMLPENSVSRETFTRQQITDLLNIADREWQGMILLGACHALRLGDAARLTWANVDMERRSLRFFPQKDRKGAKRVELEIPLHPDFEDYLLSLPVGSNRTDGPLFPALSRKKGNGANGLSNTFSRLMAEAGIIRESGSDQVTGKGRNVFTLGFHSFRHTAISEQANAGVAKERRMRLSGHKSNVHERYTHHELEALRKDVERVQSFVTARQAPSENPEP